MKRPLCLFCLTFVVILVICMQLIPMPVPDYSGWNGHELIIEGSVYQKEYRVFQNDYGSKKVLVVYLNSIQMNQSNQSIPFSEEHLQNIMCYMETGYEPAIGSRVRVLGELQGFKEATNPGEFDMRKYYHIMKIDFKLNNAVLQAISPDYDVFKEWLYQIRSKMAAILDYCFDENNASIMKAMVLGDKGNLDTDTKKLYTDSGIIHILAISGLHISMIGMGLYKLLRKCRIPPAVSVPICIVMICSYGLMTGLSASAARAIFMFVLRLIANLIGRSYDMLTAVSLVAVLLLLEQPRYVEYNGFLFSFGAIAAMGVLLPVLYDKGADLKKSRIKWKWFFRLKQSAASGIAVAIATLPIYLVFNYQFPIFSVILNLLIIPLMTIVMYDGLFCIFAGSIFPLLAEKAAWINVGILWFYEKCCLLCQRFGYGNVIAGQPEKWQVTVYILLLSVLVFINKKVTSWWKVQWILVAFMVLMFRSNDGLAITIIDVGQGDGIHIRSDSGKHYLIDGGSSSKLEVSTYSLMPYLKSQGASRLAAVFVTHGDEDHCNGVKELMEEANIGGVKIDCLFLPDIDKKSRDESYHELINIAVDNNITVKYMRRGQYIQDGDMKISCIHPSLNYDTDSSNESSLVLSLSYKEFRGLFTGDIEGRGEHEMEQYIKKNPELAQEISVLKVAHHGSKYSTNMELLELLKPKIALISCGERNRYGHPHPETLERLSEIESTIYATKDVGAIQIYTDGRRVTVRGFKIKRNWEK